MCIARCETAGFLEQQRSCECHDERRPEQKEHVAEGEDVRLLLHNFPDSHEGPARRMGSVTPWAMKYCVSFSILVRVACSNRDTDAVRMLE